MLTTLRLLVLSALLCTQVQGQEYEDYCSPIPSKKIGDYLLQNDSLYYTTTLFGIGGYHNISVIDETRTETSLYQSNLSVGGARFFKTGPYTWDLVLADLISKDVSVQQIHTVSKLLSGDLKNEVYKPSDHSSFLFSARHIFTIERYLLNYNVIGGTYRSILSSDDIEYHTTSSDAEGFKTRHIFQSYSWADRTIYDGFRNDKLYESNNDIIDIAFDSLHNYILFSDHILVMDTLMQIVQDSLPLRPQTDEVKQLEVEDCCFYILEDGNLDRITRYAKEDMNLFGWMYLETSPDYGIVDFKLDDENLTSKSEISNRGFGYFLHKQEKRFLPELTKRASLEMELLSSDLSFDSAGLLTGTISVELLNTGDLPVRNTAIYSNIYIGPTPFSRAMHTILIDSLILPGQSIVVSDTLNIENYHRNDISFFIHGADGHPLRQPSEVNLPISLSSATHSHLGEEINIYPNPINFGNLIHYEIPWSGNGLINLTDMSGQSMMEMPINPFGIIDLGQLSQGMYLMKFRMNTGQSSTHKLIVR